MTDTSGLVDRARLKRSRASAINYNFSIRMSKALAKSYYLSSNRPKSYDEILTNYSNNFDCNFPVKRSSITLRLKGRLSGERWTLVLLRHVEENYTVSRYLGSKPEVKVVEKNGENMTFSSQ